MEARQMPAKPRRPVGGLQGPAQPSKDTVTAKKPVGRPKSAPSTIVNVRLPLTLVAELDRYLDLAARANLPWVRIVHGKGSGALRAEVQDVLKRNALVDRFELAEASAGGDGVTVAFLKD